jgi:SnoaL-like domain
VSLQVSPGRPLARLVVPAATGGRPTRKRRSARAYSPPEPGPSLSPAELSPHQLDQVHLAERVLHGLLLTPDDADTRLHADDDLAPDAVVWSPTVLATTRAEAAAALRPLRDHDDALTEVRVLVVATHVLEDRVFLEWRLTARFTNPCFIDDDLLVEPTGRLVETAGVQVATFRGEQLTSVHCYYDDLALLEQLVT